MKNWRKSVIAPDTTIREAIEKIEVAALQIGLVLDQERRLAGTITDGDVRRAILKGTPLDHPAASIMNTTPITARLGDSREAMLAVMHHRSIRHLPILAEGGVVAGLATLDDLVCAATRNNPVLLMAGGLGRRLRPLTDDCPKPLLSVGGKPILETILENFASQGFREFFVSVNYKAEMIEDYFGDGSRWGVKISYLRELQRMGTAGSLSLLPPGITEPIIVMNGDLLAEVDFDLLLRFHEEQKAKATLCIREYEVQIPYGVVNFDQHRLVSIREKPVHNFHVSAGIYVLDPELLPLIPRDTFFDMPALLDRLVAEKHQTAVFRISDFWLDIGKMNDFERANSEYLSVFQ